jgi:glycosyltransferase involved in cell wall biosynthesis
MSHVDKPIRLVMVGEGTQRTRTEELAESLGVVDRIEFAGSLDERGTGDLYKGALAVVYCPFDEDYGYVTLESFLSHKPVITTTDAGGPLEFVEHETSGLVCRHRRSGSRRDQPSCVGQSIGRAALATRDTSARGSSRGMGSLRKLVGESESVSRRVQSRR